MKKTYLSLVCFSLISFSAVAADRAPVPVLSKAEQKAVLNEIGNSCGDTWCGGDYGYDFNSFGCSATVDGTNCDLNFVMIRTDYVAKSKVEARVEQRFPVTCTFGPFQKKSDIIAKEYSNFPGELRFSDAFLDKLNDCISDLEGFLNKK